MSVFAKLTGSVGDVLRTGLQKVGILSKPTVQIERGSPNMPAFLEAVIHEQERNYHHRLHTGLYVFQSCDEVIQPDLHKREFIIRGKKLNDGGRGSQGDRYTDTDREMYVYTIGDQVVRTWEKECDRIFRPAVDEKMIREKILLDLNAEKTKAGYRIAKEKDACTVTLKADTLVQDTIAGRTSLRGLASIDPPVKVEYCGKKFESNTLTFSMDPDGKDAYVHYLPMPEKTERAASQHITDQPPQTAVAE